MVLGTGWTTGEARSQPITREGVLEPWPVAGVLDGGIGRLSRNQDLSAA
jgi:hypothetical protein